MEVRRIAEPLKAFEWTGGKDTYKEIESILPENYEIKMNGIDIELYDENYEETVMVHLGDFIVFEDGDVDICHPNSFYFLYEEVSQ